METVILIIVVASPLFSSFLLSLQIWSNSSALQEVVIRVMAMMVLILLDETKVILLNSWSHKTACLEITVGHHLWKIVFEYNFQL